MKLCVATTALLFSSLAAAAVPPFAPAAPHSNAAQTTVKNLKHLPNAQPWWAGAIQRSRQITEASGMFRVPSVSLPANAESGVTYGGAAWVGIDDGRTCSKQIFQTGILWQVDEGGVYYHAWREWWPDTWEFWDIDIKQGDEIDMRVVVHSSTGGTAYLTNKSTGEKVSHTFGNQPELCQGTAEWIVEDYLLADGSHIPMAAFKGLEFTKASYTHNRGHRDALLGSTIRQMVQHGKKVVGSQQTRHDSVRLRFQG